MTIIQKRKILTRIQELEGEIAQLKRTRLEIARNGYASATQSGGSGSKSYTRLDLDKLAQAIAELTDELRKYRTMLRTDGDSSPLKETYTIYY